MNGWVETSSLVSSGGMAMRRRIWVLSAFCWSAVRVAWMGCCVVYRFVAVMASSMVVSWVRRVWNSCVRTSAVMPSS